MLRTTITELPNIKPQLKTMDKHYSSELKDDKSSDNEMNHQRQSIVVIGKLDEAQSSKGTCQVISEQE